MLSVGDSTLIDHNEAFAAFDVLGGQLSLAPQPAVVGILAAMRGTVGNLQSVTGVASLYTPYVVRVSSDYSGADVVA